MNAPFRPCGDYYATGQDALVCEYCDHEPDFCTCDDEPEAARCPHCDDVLIGNECRDCELSLAPVTRISPNGVVA